MWGDSNYKVHAVVAVRWKTALDEIDIDALLSSGKANYSTGTPLAPALSYAQLVRTRNAGVNVPQLIELWCDLPFATALNSISTPGIKVVWFERYTDDERTILHASSNRTEEVPDAFITTAGQFMVDAGLMTIEQATSAVAVARGKGWSRELFAQRFMQVISNRIDAL